MVKSRQSGGDTDITLHDVVAHIQHMRGDMVAMEQRLSKKIDANTKGIEANTKAIAKNSDDIEHLSTRIDALGEDLTATIKDTIKIRQHVGMATMED